MAAGARNLPFHLQSLDKYCPHSLARTLEAAEDCAGRTRRVWFSLL